jgi:hypothetical protein
MKLRILVLCAIAATAACQRESDDAKSPVRTVHPKPTVAVQRGPTVEELTAGMVEAATQGKSQAPVGLKFEILRRPVQGEPLEIAIALLPGEPAEPATVEVTGSDGLQLSEAQQKFEFPSVEPTQVYRRNIRLTPTAEGVYLLTLTVSLAHDQLSDTRVFSLPLIVEGNGSPAPASVNPPPSSPTG